jgi:hypothetical protein
MQLMKWPGPVICGLAALLSAHPATAQVLIPVANSATGTTNGLIAKGTGAPTTAVTSATTDTSGYIGVVVSGGGTTGTAYIATAGGPLNCTFDAGNIVANHWVVNSAATAGNCKDGGAVSATPTVSGVIIGISMATGSGSQPIVVVPSPGIASVSGASLSGNNTWTGTNFFNAAELYASGNPQAAAYTLTANDCGHAVIYTGASAANITTVNSLPVGCTVTIVQSGAGQVTVVNGSGATLSSVNTYTKTKAQYAVIGLTVDTNVGGTAAHFILSGDGA